LPLDQYAVNGIPPEIRVRVDHGSSSHIKAGLRFHSVLSRVRDSRDLDRVIAQAVKHGVISTDPDDACNVERVEAHVRQPIMDPACRVSQWFDPANMIYSERTITTASASLWDDGIENLRPDRIVRRPDGTMLVIDYKSGERRDKQYCRQVRQYMAKLRTIYPDTPIAGRIWYITHDLILDEQGHQLPMAL
jgi:ATP-dependent exoDNAse (exonuclease V) beta subunit